jgi:Protein of unknown function (DUF3987)
MTAIDATRYVTNASMTPFSVTFFNDHAAQSKRQANFTIASLAEIIRTTAANEKGRLPWLKLARFGNSRTEKGSLRHDRNVIACSGLEADYDGEQISFEEAVDTIDKAGLQAIVYTSPSYTETAPRFRVLCPFSVELPPDRRGAMLGRLNGLFRGVFASESWTLSQSYYYGSVNNNPAHRVEVIEGRAIDLCDELDETWLGKPHTVEELANFDFRSGPVDEDALSQRIVKGEAYHVSCTRLIGLWAQQGVPFLDAQKRLIDWFDAVPSQVRDERWQIRRDDVPRIVLDIYGKQAGQRDEAEARAGRTKHRKRAANEYDADVAPWPVMDDAAYYGLARDVVKAIEPHTEADPVAILIQYLAAAGNAIGRGPYYQVEADRHCANIFAVLVGDTAKGRKGTSWGRVRQIMEIADPDWARERVHSGLSSGEGVIWNVRDEIRNHNGEITDTGVADKRLYVIEPEFAGTLAVMRREGSILSRIIRDGWDRGDLATLTKNSPTRATGAHISVVGHITAGELRKSLDRLSIINGYANRFLWGMARRARVLPFGGSIEDRTILELGTRTACAIEAARAIERVTLTTAARDGWALVYPELSEGRPGLLGAVLARGEAQTIRLALICALLDGRAEIDIVHLKAALAIWEYCAASALCIFGDALGDPAADEILRALRQAGGQGLSRTGIRDLFGRHQSADQIARALLLLATAGRARLVTRDTPGRSAEVWIATAAVR